MQTQVVQIAASKLAHMSIEDIEKLNAIEEIESVSQLVRNAEAEQYQLDA